jgi:hypothetical protein
LTSPTRIAEATTLSCATMLSTEPPLRKHKNKNETAKTLEGRSPPLTIWMYKPCARAWMVHQDWEEQGDEASGLRPINSRSES